jgi:predicted  nucleic acid-binding Zn-ribbon protein
MAVTRQLYELQELDTNIEHTEQTLRLKSSQLGNRDVLNNTQNSIAAEQKRLEELKKSRRDTDGQTEDLSVKIKNAEQQLYGGTVKNPKELSNLQHEIKNLKEQRDPLETKSLETSEQIEAAEKKTADLTADYARQETEWQTAQTVLAGDIDLLTKTLDGLREERGQIAEQIEPGAIILYDRVRLQKKPAVTRVEQGICRACRLSLSVSVLQKARAGQPVQCSTCGRILFVS